MSDPRPNRASRDLVLLSKLHLPRDLSLLHIVMHPDQSRRSLIRNVQPSPQIPLEDALLSQGAQPESTATQKKAPDVELVVELVLVEANPAYEGAQPPHRQQHPPLDEQSAVNLLSWTAMG